MTPLLVALLAAVPCVYWTAGVETQPALEAAAVRRICVAPDQAEPWRPTGIATVPIPEADLASREVLLVPGVTARAGLASPTRMPYVVASGWRMLRNPDGRFVYTVPAGKAALAMAEAFAYGADALLRIDPADLPAAGSMTAFLTALPAADFPAVADLAVIDDGTPVSGEVMNLLARRNLLFEVVQAASPRAHLTIRIGSPEFPVADAADPNAFALKIRRQLTDDRRALRIFGSEVVVGRLTAEGGRARLHLLNYGGREIQGLRLRVRGRYRAGQAHVAGAGTIATDEQSVVGANTELSLPRLLTYAAIDLE